MVYEMLAGEPPHHGTTVQAIVARILSDEAEPITKHRPSVPPHVDAAVRKALDRTPADRFSTAAKFAEALTNPSFTTARTTATPIASTAPSHRRSALAVVSAGAALFAILAAWGWLRPPADDTQPVIRYRVLERALDQSRDFGTNLAISPDGEVIVRAGYDEEAETFGLRVQRRSQLESTPLPGGEEAHQPFFAPDGEHVGFITIGRALRVASLSGEPTVTLVDSGIVRGSGSWGTDGFIYITGGNVGIEAGVTAGIVRIPASGGDLEVITRLDTVQGEVGHTFPETLPGGRGVLFTISRLRLYTAEDEAIAVVDLATGTHRILLEGVQARWSPTGHILVVQADGRLVAVPFDEQRLEPTGSAVPLLDGVRVDGLGSADLALSSNGRLVYGAGTSEAGAELLMQWTGRDGQTRVVDTTWSGFFLNPSVSPNQTMMAVQIGIPPSAEVWVKQLDRGPFSRLTFDGGFSGNPSWTADGRSVLYLSDRAGSGLRPYVKRADGSDEPRQLLDVQVTEARYSRDGRWLVYNTDPRAADPGIYALRVGQDSGAALLVPRRYGEGQISLSPDGRWLAYTSRESGQTEVYVRPFPGSASARWQVSVDGGFQPAWAPSSRELYYVAPGTGQAIAVSVGAGSVFAAGEQRTLFGLDNIIQANGWDVAPDGRFATVTTRVGAAGDHDRELVVVENFFEELREKIGR
jgi:serine/threonine-protein kinase